ncbi:MAG: diguanylate cyclase [Acidobacteriota bacterium]
MRVAGRQDLLLLAGLAAAAVIVFSTPISRLLDYARDIERESGLALVPALILLTGVYIVHQLRKRHQIQAAAAAAETAQRDAERRAQEFERLVAFGHALARSLDHDSIRGAIAQHLARLAGTDQVWVLLRQGTEWEALAGDTRGAEEVIERQEMATRLANGAAGGDTQGIGFPLIVGGTTTGVLGVRPPPGGLAPDQQRALETAAALLAVSIKNAQLFREVRENSLRDPLTGCVTRAHAMEVIDAELRRARRSQMPVSLIMFDLDHFKEVNDRFGHLCGDAVLAAVGKRMRDVLRGSDLKCRYGGEEFLVLLPETPLHGARRVAETLRREIADRPVAWSGEALTITASFGLTQAMPGEVNIEAIIARADQALYRAKDEGRNCVRIASDGLALVGDERKQG